MRTVKVELEIPEPELLKLKHMLEETLDELPSYEDTIKELFYVEGMYCHQADARESVKVTKITVQDK